MKTKRKLLALSKRALAMMLAALMVVTLVPSSIVFAQTPEGDEAVYEVPAEDALAGDALGDDSTQDEVIAPEEILKEGEDASDAPAGPAEEKKLVTEITVRETDLGNKINSWNGWYISDLYNPETNTMMVPFNEDQPKEYYHNKIYGTTNTDINLQNYVDVKVDGVVKNTELKSLVEYTWQKQGTDGKWTDLALDERPYNVGLYRVVASLKAVESKCTEVKEAVILNVDIQKAVIDLTVSTEDITPGITVAKLKEAKSLLDGNFEINLLPDAWKEATKEFNSYAKEVKIDVREEYADVILKDDDVLTRGKDYRLIYTVTLKDDVAESYVIGKSEFVIDFDEKVATEVEVTYTTPGKEYFKVYDGKPLTDEFLSGEYTAQVNYQSDEVDNGKNGMKKLEGAEVTGSFYDVNDNPCPEPVDAGSYYYCLSYAGDDDYEYSDVHIPVEIKMATIIIDPIIESNIIYPEQSVQDILNRVSYNVYQVTNGTKNATPEDITDYYWGVAYNNKDYNRTQKYEPLFAIQKAVQAPKDPKKPEELQVVGWADMGRNDTIKLTERITVQNAQGDDVQVTQTNQYRLVFSGKKAVYASDGTPSSLDINASEKNYSVDYSEAAMKTFSLVKDLKVENAALAVIDITGITSEQNGLGQSFANPATKYYDGKDFYETKEGYKKAAVKEGTTTLAEGNDATLTYTWYYANDWVKKLDDKDKTLFTWEVAESGWAPARFRNEGVVDGNYNNVDNHSSPYSSGTYKLVISYKDPEHKHYANSVEVYYTIIPNNAVAVLTGNTNPAIYADGKLTPADLIYSIQYSDPEATETYVALDLYSATVSENSDKKGTVVKESEPFASNVEQFYWNPTWYFKVERLGTKDEEKDKWITCDWDDVLEKDIQYRINLNNDHVEAYYDKNYNFGKKLDAHNQSLDDNYYENETLAVKIKNTEAIRLVLDYDPAKINDNIKVYDGKTFNLDSLKSILKVRTADTGEDVTDKVKDSLVYTFTGEMRDIDGDDFEFSTSEPIHVSNYTLTISRATDDTYASMAETLYTGEYNNAGAPIPVNYQIQKKELVVRPVLQENITAGGLGAANDTSANAVNNKVLTQEAFSVETALAEGDSDVIKEVTFGVNDATGRSYLNSVLRSKDTYFVKGTGCDWNNFLYCGYKFSYGVDYKLKYEAASFKPVRVAGEVTGLTFTMKTLNALEEKDGKFTHTIATLDGIPYIDGLGNYAVFAVYKPLEFNEAKDVFDQEDTNFIFRNSITASGGVIFWDEDEDNIWVGYDVSKGGKPSFEIIWEDGYSEEYIVDLDQMKPYMEADLTKAVAPKSLSFNGVSTKMVVGQTQQLDVKMTKFQLRDTILLGYRSSDESVLKVSDTGMVTALKANKGSVLVEVFPCVMVNGEKVPIEGKVKIGKVKISVSEVAVPKISKVNASDTWAQVTYVRPANGYRREIYVLEGSKKPADFEAEIANVKNGDYSAFVYTNLRSAENVINEKKNLVETYIYNLNPKNTVYTVYVRNVSAMRTLVSGIEVAESHAGSVKTFKTTSSKIQQLGGWIEGAKADSVVYGENQRIEMHDGYYYDGYVVNLSEKSVNLVLQAKLMQRYSKDYSDRPDYIWRKLPLDKELKKNYSDAKFTYYICDEEPQNNRQRAIDKWGSEKNFVEYNGLYYKKTATIASINKKGKITLKGMGDAYVIAIDSVSGQGISVKLRILAKPDSMTAKSAKLAVGNGLALSSLLEYKEGSTKLAGYTAPRLNNNAHSSYDDEDYEEYLTRLYTTAQSDENFYVRKYEAVYGRADYAVETRKAGVALEAEVTDDVVKLNGGSSVKVKINASQLEAVKKPKVQSVNDDKFTVTFNYPYNYNDFNNDNGLSFRFVLKDSKGNIIKNQLVRPASNPDTKSKKPNYIYTYEFEDIDRTTSMYWGDNYELALLSQYTVDISAVYEGQESKAAKVKIKTTDVPLSYVELSSNPNAPLYDGDKYYYGGEEITAKTVTRQNDYFEIDSYRTWKNDSHGSAFSYDAYYPMLLKTGNTYTLTASVDGEFGQYAQSKSSDSYIWKVKDGKIAKIKAKTNVSAQITTVKQGETIIEVSSKLTKKVVARYRLVVSATGDAKSYFGTNEPYHDEDATYLEYLRNEALELTLGNPVSVMVGKGETQYFRFVAPQYGQYAIAGYDDLVTDDRDANDRMLKGQEIIVSVSNLNNSSKAATISVTGTLYDDAQFGSDNHFKGNKQISFKAPEENYYTFTRIDLSKDEDDPARETEFAWRSLNAGQVAIVNVGGDSYKEYTIKITKRELNGTLDINAATAVSESMKWQDDDHDVRWYAFTAKEDNIYEFSFAKLTGGSLTVERYTSLKNEDAAGSYPFYENAGNQDTDIQKIENIALKKDQTVYFRLTVVPTTPGISKDEEANPPVAEQIAKPVTFQMSVAARKLVKELTNGEKEDLSLAANTTSWYKFTAKKPGWYTISTTSATDVVTAYRLASLDEAIVTGVATGNTPVIALAANRKDLNAKIKLTEGQTIYLAISSNGATEAKPVTASLTITLRDATKLVIGEAGKIALADAQAEQWFEFEADEYGLYTFNTKNAKDGTIAVEYYENLQDAGVAFNVGDEDVTADYKASDIARNNRSKLYLRITATNVGADGATADLYVTKRTMDANNSLPILQDKLVSVENGKEVWYKVVADENNYYTVRLTGDKNGAGSVRVAQYATFETTGYGSDTVTVSNDETDPTNYRTIDLGKLNKGDVRYLKFTTTADTTTKAASVTANVYKRVEEEKKLAVGDNVVDIELTARDEKWYAFTATKDNVYTIYSENVANLASLGGVVISVNEKLTDDSTVIDTDKGFGYNTDGTTQHFELKEVISGNVKDGIQLKKGDTIYVGFRSAAPTTDKKVTATIKVKEREVKSALSVGGDGVSVELEAGKEVWYSFEPTENNVYTFYSTLEIAGGTVTIDRYDSLYAYDPSVYMWDGAGTFSTEAALKNMDRSKPIYLKLVGTPTGGAAGKVTFTLKIDKRELQTTELTYDPEGKAGTDVSVKVDEEKWYKFTADEENCYRFYGDGVKGQVKAVAYSNYRTETGSRNAYTSTSNGEKLPLTPTEIYLKKGESCYLRVTGTAKPADAEEASVKIKVAKRVISETNLLTMDAAGKDISFAESGEIWYKLPITEDNYYTFSFSGIEKGRVTATLFAGLTETTILENGSSTTSFTFSHAFEEGKTAYVRFTATLDGTDAAKVNVKVTKRNPVALSAKDEASSVELDGTEKWFVFSPDEAYRYVFNAKNEAGANVSMRFYGDITSNDYFEVQGADVTRQFFMGPDENIKKLYVRLDCAAATETNKVTVTFGVKRLVAEANQSTILATDTEKKVNVAVETQNNEEKTVWYAVRIANGGSYYITVAPEEGTTTGNVELYLNNESDNFLAGRYTSTNKIFSKGDIIYIAVTAAVNAKYNISFKTQSTRIVEKEIYVAEGDSYNYTFSVSENGTYEFYTRGNADTEANIKISNKNGIVIYQIIYEDDEYNDYGEGNNFKHVYTLSEGDFVELVIYDYQWDDDLTATLCVDRQS